MRMNMNKLSTEELSERLQLRSCTEVENSAGRQEMTAEEEGKGREKRGTGKPGEPGKREPE